MSRSNVQDGLAIRNPREAVASVREGGAAAEAHRKSQGSDSDGFTGEGHGQVTVSCFSWAEAIDHKLV